MTQIQPEHPNPAHQPAELHSIYEALAKLARSIPANSSNQISIPSPLSLIALTCHAFLLSHSFRSKLPSASAQEPALLTDWEALLAPNQHSLHFSYSHPQSSFTFEFTFSKLGNQILIAGVTVQDDRLSTWNLLIPEYIDPSQFPLNLTEDQQKDSNGFRSSTHLLNFISLFVNEILHGLIPDLFPMTSINQRSPPTNQTSQQATTSNSQAPPGPLNQPYNPPIQPSNQMQTPLEIGRSDLEPIGTSNLGIPSLYNHIPRADLNQRSGMMVHPNHPIFNPPSRLGPLESFHPPGARFDPIGPHNSSNPAFFSRPRPDPALDLDPMGGLGQGLPLRNPHLGRYPNRPDFNEFRPPGSGGGASGYDDMFM